MSRFAGNDVALALGYDKPNNAMSVHVDKDDKGTLRRSGKILIPYFGALEKTVDITGLTVPNRGLTVINESGMYSLILSSKLPSAKRFKHWITSEVLPSIRKTGGYGAEGSLATVIDNQRIMMRSMQALWLYLSTRDGLAAGFSREIANKELR